MLLRKGGLLWAKFRNSSACQIGYEKCLDDNCEPQGSCLKKLVHDVCYFKSNVGLWKFEYPCTNEIDLCSTGNIWPIEKPVQYWNNSCRESF